MCPYLALYRNAVTSTPQDTFAECTATPRSANSKFGLDGWDRLFSGYGQLFFRRPATCVTPGAVENHKLEYIPLIVGSVVWMKRIATIVLWVQWRSKREQQAL